MQNSNDSVGTQQSEGHAQGYHDQRLADDHPANFKARRSQRLQYADVTRTFQNHSVHRQQHDQETNRHAEDEEGANKRFQFGKVRRGHQRAEFRHRTNLIRRKQLDQFIADGLRIAFASDEEHRDAFVGAGDVLRSLQGDKEPRALSVQDDARNREFMAHKSRCGADLKLTRMRRKIIRHGLGGLLERTAGKKRKAAAETGKPGVINSVYDAQIVLVHDDQYRGDFIDSRKARDFFSKRFRNHGPRER